MEQSFFIGIDIGTQGARTVLLDEKGTEVAAKEEVFPLDNISREEQPPLGWWSSCWRSLKLLCQESGTTIDLSKVRAMAVTSTSGTIIPLNKLNEPLHPALMYSDPRSFKEAILCKEIACAAGTEGYTGFNSSSGLPKMLWFIRNYPDKMADIGRFVHAADYITGKLSGRFDVTDYTNALKSGYDVQLFRWPGYITSKLPLKKKWLQQVVPSGKPIGFLDPQLAAELGLSEQVKIATGMTDGCASQVASGAVNLGEWNTTIGTTLVVKGVTAKRINDPADALYCHRHPQGFWMPGGASNTGADWITRLFSTHSIEALNADALLLHPTGHLAWPLLQQGERFPFIAPDAKGFAPDGLSASELFTAYLEGVAYIERYAYERIKTLSGDAAKQVFTAGGGSKSDVWITIRSNVLNLPVCKMKNVTGAAGAAILAASQTNYSSLSEAVRNMVSPEKKIIPDATLVGQYRQTYLDFKNLLHDKGYIRN